MINLGGKGKLEPVWDIYLNTYFQFLNNVICIFIHFFPTRISKKYKHHYQTVTLKSLRQKFMHWELKGWPKPQKIEKNRNSKKDKSHRTKLWNCRK